MFQFRRFPSYAYLIQRTLTEYCSGGFPHSEISGSMDICSSPKLIAACHVLRRLLMPRHSPCALLQLDLTFCEQESKQRKTFMDDHLTAVSPASSVVLLSSSKKGLALVLKRLNYAGSEFFEIVFLCYPFRKVPQIIFCFPLLLASHISIYIVQFSRCVSSFFKPDPNI